MINSEILAEAKRIAPEFWPKDPWSVDLSCKQAQQRAIEQAKRNLATPNKGESK